MQKGGLSDNIESMQKVANKKESGGDIIEEMFSVGAHYGYGKSRRHPSVSSYIYTTKNKTDIIDLEKTDVMLKNALEFVKNLGAKNKTILFVGTKPEAKEAIRITAEALNMPYVNERWIGGIISNFSEIKKRIAELENYRKDSATGGLDKYTKKERVVMSKKMDRLARYYSGLVGLKKAPDVIFMIDAREEKIAFTEANTFGIEVVALTNSDTNIKGIDYPIVANDASKLSITYFTKSIEEAYKAGVNSVK